MVLQVLLVPSIKNGRYEGSREITIPAGCIICGCARDEVRRGKSIDRYGNIVPADFWRNYCGHYETYEMINRYYAKKEKKESELIYRWRQADRQQRRTKKPR